MTERTLSPRRIADVLRAAITYFTIVFVAAFLIGALRVTLIAPLIGAFLAVAAEVPVILFLSWFTVKPVLRRWPLTRGERIAMGAVAFGLLMAAEWALATVGFGQTTTTFLSDMTTAHGALGLLGQIGFAVIPSLAAQPRG